MQQFNNDNNVVVDKMIKEVFDGNLDNMFREVEEICFLLNNRFSNPEILGLYMEACTKFYISQGKDRENLVALIIKKTNGKMSKDDMITIIKYIERKFNFTFDRGNHQAGSKTKVLSDLSLESEDIYTKEQKLAILHCIFRVANINVDSPSYHKKTYKIAQLSDILGIKISDPDYTQVLRMEDEKAYRILIRLNKDQKETIIILLHSMVVIEGDLPEVELGTSLLICENIGITMNQYYLSISKNDSAIKDIARLPEK